MRINALWCWVKGFGITPGGRSWWGVKQMLLHPTWNVGDHDDEKINFRTIDDITYYDFRCRRCGRISDNFQDVTDKNARIVIADLNQAVNGRGQYSKDGGI